MPTGAVETALGLEREHFQASKFKWDLVRISNDDKSRRKFDEVHQSLSPQPSY